MTRLPISLVQDAPTRVTGHMFDLPQGQTRTFPGGPLGNHRKWINIWNDDEGNRLYIIRAGSDPNIPQRICTLRPNTSILLHTSDDITIAAPDGDIDVSGKVGACQVMEAFYV